MFDLYFFKPGANLSGQESGRLRPPVGIISATGPVVVAQRHIDMKCCARTGQGHVEDAAFFFETF
jgi:hypothetical protein